MFNLFRYLLNFPDKGYEHLLRNEFEPDLEFARTIAAIPRKTPDLEEFANMLLEKYKSGPTPLYRSASWGQQRRYDRIASEITDLLS